MGNTLNLTLKIWRMQDPASPGRFENYEMRDVSPDVSFLDASGMGIAFPVIGHADRGFLGERSLGDQRTESEDEREQTGEYSDNGHRFLRGGCLY